MNKQKKTFSQVQVVEREPRGDVKEKAEAVKPSSELSELTVLVRKLTLNQEEQFKKLAELESQIHRPNLQTPVRNLQPAKATIRDPVLGL